MEREGRDISLDIMKITSCLLVLIGHISAEAWYNLSPRTYAWTVLNFIDTLARPSIPVFVMVSGSLFLRKKQIDIKRLWLKNILHLLIIYVFWTLFYAVMEDGVKKGLRELVFSVTNLSAIKPAVHLWYLRTTIMLYIISPLLWNLVRVMDKSKFRYFLIIFAVFGLLRNTLYNLPFTTYWMREQIVLWGQPDLVGYSAYFMLGYFLSDEEWVNKFSSKKLLLVFLLSVFIAAALNQWISIANGGPSEALLHDFALPAAIEAVCLFLFIRKKCSSLILSKTKEKILTMVSSSTLFTYLIHLFVIQRLRIYFGIDVTNFNVLLSAPVITIIVFTLCTIVGIILERIPVVNKIL